MNDLESSIPEELRIAYIQRRKTEIDEIFKALQLNDFESIEFIGHRMKGNGLSFGFPEISQLGEQLEISARKHQASDVKVLAEDLVKWANRQVH